jgi:tRNA threonylcarbamoyladenosine biosynthesis protein TsaE
MNITLTTIENTYAVGANIASSVRGGDIITLTGDLGTGKTTLAKGILAYFGVPPETVTSPTFSIMNMYETIQHNDTIKHIVHIDTYRLSSAEELLEIGFEDYLHDPETLILIEWPEKVQHLLNSVEKNLYKYTLEHTENGSRNLISLI